MTKPSDCGQCRDLFMSNRLMQAEMRHMAVKEGQAAAEMELNERLQERHESHEAKAAG